MFADNKASILKDLE